MPNASRLWTCFPTPNTLKRSCDSLATGKPMEITLSKKLFYREYGQGSPLLFLHGGWGYGFYPLDVQIEQMQSQFRILIPDRTGYGNSERLTSFPLGFHEHAAEEMRQFLDALGIRDCFLWGHSDGAVTAARMALSQPERFPAVILEAIHYDRCKP